MANPCFGRNSEIVQAVIYDCEPFIYCGDLCELVNEPVCTDPPLTGSGTVDDCVRIENGGMTGDCITWDGDEWVIGPCPPQPACTDPPLEGTGLTGDCIRIQPGGMTGDCIIWDGTQWVITPCPPSAVCTDDPIIGTGLTGDCIGLTAGTNCGQQLQWGATGAHNPNAWSLTRPPGQTEVTIGLAADGALYPTVAAALADGCTFLRVISDVTEAGVTVTAPTIIYIDPGITWAVTSPITASAELLIMGNSSQASSMLNYTTTTGVPFVGGVAGTNISFRRLLITNSSGAVANTVLADPTLVIYIEDVVFQCANAIHTFLGNGLDATTTAFTKLTIDGLELRGGGNACDEAIDIPQFTNHVRATTGLNGPIRISNLRLVNSFGWQSVSNVIRSASTTLALQEAVTHIIWENITIVDLFLQNSATLSGTIDNITQDPTLIGAIQAGFNLTFVCPRFLTISAMIFRETTVVSNVNVNGNIVLVGGETTTNNPFNGVVLTNSRSTMLSVSNPNHVLENIICTADSALGGINFTNAHGTSLNNFTGSLPSSYSGGMMLSNIQHISVPAFAITSIVPLAPNHTTLHITNLFVRSGVFSITLASSDSTLIMENVSCASLGSVGNGPLGPRITLSKFDIREQLRGVSPVWSATDLIASDWHISWAPAAGSPILTPSFGNGAQISNWDVEAPAGVTTTFSTASGRSNFTNMSFNRGGGPVTFTVAGGASVKGIFCAGDLDLTFSNSQEANVSGVRCEDGLFVDFLSTAFNSNLTDVVDFAPSFPNTGLRINQAASNNTLKGINLQMSGVGSRGVLIEGENNTVVSSVFNYPAPAGGGTGFILRGEGNVVDGNIITMGIVGGLTGVLFEGDSNVISNNRIEYNYILAGSTGGNLEIQGVKHVFSGNSIRMQGTISGTARAGDIVIGGTGHMIGNNVFDLPGLDTPTVTMDTHASSFTGNQLVSDASLSILGATGGDFNFNGTCNLISSNFIEQIGTPPGIGTRPPGNLNFGGTGHHVEGNYIKENTGLTGTGQINVAGASASFSNNRINVKGHTFTAINVTGAGNRFMANNIDNLDPLIGIGGAAAAAASTVYIGNYTPGFDITTVLAGSNETANLF